MRKWQDNPAVAGEVTHEEMKSERPGAAGRGPSSGWKAVALAGWKRMRRDLHRGHSCATGARAPPNLPGHDAPSRLKGGGHELPLPCCKLYPITLPLTRCPEGARLLLSEERPPQPPQRRGRGQYPVAPRCGGGGAAGRKEGPAWAVTQGACCNPAPVAAAWRGALKA
jgi:hypothetical protein